MDMSDLITPAQVVTLRAANKAQLLQELARRAAKPLGLEIQAILDPLLAREALGSTGVGEGVAVPHAKVAGLKHFFALFARLEKPLNFDAVDGQPVDLVLLLLIPAEGYSDHLAALACVARRLRDPEIARQLRANADPAALYELLCGSSSTPRAGIAAKA
ncbi:MAG TPA: PTS sugar transporter subunit IIA [Methylovirgula sp.]